MAQRFLVLFLPSPATQVVAILKAGPGSASVTVKFDAKPVLSGIRCRFLAVAFKLAFPVLPGIFGTSAAFWLCWQ